MRYAIDMDIEAPRDRVVAAFLDPDNLSKWQPELVSFEPLDGGPERRMGARTRQVHKMGARQIEMVETITVFDPPGRFSATYEADGVWNLVENRFTEAGPGRTHWHLETEFRCTTLMMKLMIRLAPWMFRKQTRLYMERFRAFVEAG